MSDDKIDPESLALRAAPRRVVRFKRNLLIGLAVTACVAIFAVTWLALRPASHGQQLGPELNSPGRKATPDALAALPGGYGQMAKPAPAPALGPPLPGDLGPPVMAREQQLGIAPAEPFRPRAEDDAAQARRLHLAQQAQQAKEAGLFFQLNQHSGATTELASAGAAGQGEAPAANADKLTLDLERDQNDQQRKLDFMNQATKATVSEHKLQMPVSPYEVMAGTVIAAALIPGLKSDLPGTAMAQVTENIYDTVTGRFLLIPQGSRLIGTYDSVVAFGQSRSLVVWQRIVMPNGWSIQLDNLPATDPAGYAGLEGDVDYHTWRLLEGVAMSTLLGVGTQVTFGSSQSNLVQAIRQSSQESTNQVGQRIVEKDLNIQPTLTDIPGQPLRVIVHKDIVLKPYQDGGLLWRN
jgi:type IV secretion system protein VirB10